MKNSNIVTLQLVDSFQGEAEDSNGRKRKVWPRVYGLPDSDTRYIRDEEGLPTLERITHGSQQQEGPNGQLLTVKEPIYFFNGRVSYDKLLMPHTHRFLMNNSHNVSSPNRDLNASKLPIFIVLDFAKEKEEETKTMLSEAKVLAKFDVDHKYAYTEEQILSYAIAKGFDTDQKTSAIKRDVMVAAKQNPADFERDINDSHLMFDVYIRKAIAHDIISLNDKRKWVWSFNHGIITSVPTGTNEFDHIKEYCITNPQGNVDLKEIMSRVDKYESTYSPQKTKSIEQKELESFEMNNVVDENFRASKKEDLMKKEIQKKQGNPMWRKKG